MDLKTSPQLAYIVGAFLAEGSLYMKPYTPGSHSRYKVIVEVTTEEYIQRILQAARDLGVNTTTYQRKTTAKGHRPSG
jgi:DNA-binding transcriptional regulator WhiA